MKEDLTLFIPESRRTEKIKLEEYLSPVAERLREILPPDKIWELFSSAPHD